MRRIPGPANCLKDEHLKDNHTHHYQENKRIDPISQISWMNLKNSLGVNEKEVDWPHDLIPYTIRDILNGHADLRVARMAALVLSVVHTTSGIWTITLTDQSPVTIEAFVTPKAVEMFPGLITPGSSFLAENVSLYVSSPTCQRILNIHERCIVAIFPSQNYQQSESTPDELSLHNDEDD